MNAPQFPLNTFGYYTFVKTKSGCEIWFPIDQSDETHVELKKQEVKDYINCTIRKPKKPTFE